MNHIIAAHDLQAGDPTINSHLIAVAHQLQVGAIAQNFDTVRVAHKIEAILCLNSDRLALARQNQVSLASPGRACKQQDSK